MAFGACREEGGGLTIMKPDDPMAELTLLPGDPDKLSATSGRMARVYEIASAAFIVLNVAINIPLMFILLLLLIR